ncbi:glycosyl/glycerophosphate transferase, teichoic acid biosynthesis [Burkholderiales bacterium JOSHI_001]|nr:glycosyl/glycerophosphate transferase, teichoic acid biosynthesis [Burkholderiales bacterium JOSHI_001]
MPAATPLRPVTAPAAPPVTAAASLSIDPLDYALKAAAVKRVGRSRKRVLFLVHAAEIFSALEPLVVELQSRADRFELVFAAIPRNYSGRIGECSGAEATRDFLAARGLSPILLQGRGVGDLIRLVQMAPDFIFRQTPWEHHIPPLFHARMLQFAALCYVPYGMGTIEKPQHQYNQPFHNQCDFVFAESQYHLERYAQHRAMGTLGVVLTGYPRFEHFAHRLDSEQHAWPLAVPDDMPRLIWAPHHTVERSWLNYSTFIDHHQRLLAEAQRGRLSILFRPHPALAEKLQASGLMSADDYAAYLAAFEATGTSGVDRCSDYIAQFGASDMMVTDGLGFFSEYLLTGKPLVRTFKPGAEAMNHFGNWCAEAAHVVQDGAELQAVLDAVGEHRYEDAQLAARLERRDVLLAMCQGASARIADALQAG